MSQALAIAYHSLSAMLDAGVPILRSIDTVGSGLKPRMRKAFLALADGVSKGNTLAETMSQQPRVFGPVDVLLIEVAEKSGNLPDLIRLLSKWHEMADRMLKSMLSGLLMPLVVLTIAAFVIPLVSFVGGGLEMKSYLLAVAKTLRLFWVPAGIIFFIVRATPKTGPLRRLLDRIALRIPILGVAIYTLALSRYCWAFHMLCKAGVPVTNSVGMANSVVGNTVVADQFRPAVESVRAGRQIFEGFSSKLPLELVERWKIGEETGQLDDVSERLAHNYADEAEFKFAQFAFWFPRFVYALICLRIIWQILSLAAR